MAMGSIDKIINYRYQMHGTGAAEAAMQKLNMAAIAVAGAMVALTVSSVKVASAFAEVENQFNITFGDAAPEARAEMDAFADSVGRSGDRMLTFAASIQSMLIPIGVVREEAAGMSVTAVKLATDLGSFWNTDTQTVIQDMQSAFAGMSRPMRKYGMDVSDSAVAAELLTMGIQGGTAAATGAEEAIARLNIMIRQSGDSMGDTLRTSGEFENQMRTLEDAWYDTRVEIGQEVIPILQELIPEVTTLMGDFKEFAVEIIPAVIESMVNLAPSIMNMIDLLGQLAPLFNTVAWGWEKLTGLAEAWDVSNMLTVSEGQEQALWERQQQMIEIQSLSDANLLAMNNQIALTGQYWNGVAQSSEQIAWAQEELFSRWPGMRTEITSTTVAVSELNTELSNLSGGGGEGGGGEPPFIKNQKLLLEMSQMQKLSSIESEQLLLDSLAKRQLIVQDIGRSEMENARMVGDIMSGGAYEFGRILANGGKDWQAQMLHAIAEMGLEFARMQFGKSLGAFGGPLFGFLGGIL